MGITGSSSTTRLWIFCRSIFSDISIHICKDTCSGCGNIYFFFGFFLLCYLFFLLLKLIEKL